MNEYIYPGRVRTKLRYADRRTEVEKGKKRVAARSVWESCFVLLGFLKLREIASFFERRVISIPRESILKNSVEWNSSLKRFYLFFEVLTLC